MFLRARRTHLAPLGQTSRVTVTVRTVESLPRAVFGMTEFDPISRRVSRRARVCPGRMTHSTRCEVTSVRLRIRRVTAVTAPVRIQTCGYRQCRAAPQRRTVTSDATALRLGIPRHVLRVIETDVEALFETIGKASAWRVAAIHTLMADRAHRNIRRSELRQMTTRAVLVTRKTRTHRIVRTTMAVGACKRCVLRTRVQEF